MYICMLLVCEDKTNKIVKKEYLSPLTERSEELEIPLIYPSCGLVTPKLSVLPTSVLVCGCSYS